MASQRGLEYKKKRFRSTPGVARCFVDTFCYSLESYTDLFLLMDNVLRHSWDLVHVRWENDKIMYSPSLIVNIDVWIFENCLSCVYFFWIIRRYCISYRWDRWQLLTSYFVLTGGEKKKRRKKIDIKNNKIFDRLKFKA